MREQAIKVWANHCRRFRLSPYQCIGFTFPAHEKVRVDAALAADIQKLLDESVAN